MVDRHCSALLIIPVLNSGGTSPSVDPILTRTDSGLGYSHSWIRHEISLLSGYRGQYLLVEVMIFIYSIIYTVLLFQAYLEILL